MAKKKSVGENTGNMKFLPKHRDHLCVQVVNSLIVKVKVFAIFALKKPCPAKSVSCK